MQLILGISNDGFIAKSENDDMKWLKADKKIFKLLSSTNSGICLVSEKTAKLMPKTLDGRTLLTVSRKIFDLDQAYNLFPNANLLGGQTLAKVAIEKGYVTDIFLTYAPINLKEGIEFELNSLISSKFKWIRELIIDGIIIAHWRKL